MAPNPVFFCFLVDRVEQTVLRFFFSKLCFFFAQILLPTTVAVKTQIPPNTIFFQLHRGKNFKWWQFNKKPLQFHRTQQGLVQRKLTIAQVWCCGSIVSSNHRTCSYFCISCKFTKICKGTKNKDLQFKMFLLKNSWYVRIRMMRNQFMTHRVRLCLKNKFVQMITKIKLFITYLKYSYSVGYRASPV